MKKAQTAQDLHYYITNSQNAQRIRTGSRPYRWVPFHKLSDKVQDYFRMLLLTKNENYAIYKGERS